MRRSSSVLGVWGVLREELQKLPAILRFRATEAANSASRAYQFLKGVNLNESEEMAEKRKKHREAYEEIMRQQQCAASASSREAAERSSFAHRLKLLAVSFFEAMKNATSTNAGAMALLQHCAASHAAEVAVEENIDVKSVNFVLEQKKTGTHVGHEKVFVGYITAPNASEEEVMAFAEKLRTRCPVAKSMGEKIEWRRVPPATPRDISSNGGGGGGQANGAESFLPGTPGSGRYSSSSATNGRNLQNSNAQHNFDSDGGKENPENKK